MKNVGIVGWRGMVGSVLMDRMQEEDFLSKIKATFYSTSQAGEDCPFDSSKLVDAYDLNSLSDMDIIITCQGSGYTEKIHSQLRSKGWEGYWIDAASSLRMDEKAVIVLDPVNKNVIEKALNNNQKDFIGGNCTVSLMLMALGGLFRENHIEWMTSMTYQAASGAGAQNMKELLTQMGELNQAVSADLSNPASAILDIDQKVLSTMQSSTFSDELFGTALAGSLIPWIDTKMENGQSREEWKAQAEANKILQTDKLIPIDGTCVRIGAMRSHSQAFTIKLKKDLPINEIEELIKSSNEWVDFIPNDKEATVSGLTPKQSTGSLRIPVGRVRKMTLGGEYLNAFTCGDQLLWGAAEPLYRMLKLISL